MGKTSIHVVFDLDDTLYKEADYVDSALGYAGGLVEELYGLRNVKTRLRELWHCGNKAPLNHYWVETGLPGEALNEMVAAMRVHRPNIQLTDGARHCLSILKSRDIGWSILTDGRSVTQRQKIAALGLLYVKSIYISQERSVAKPSVEAFAQIMRDFPNASGFAYVADNPAKDFIGPNQLDWMTVMLADCGRNIHPQTIPLSGQMCPKKTISSLEALPELIAKN